MTKAKQQRAQANAGANKTVTAAPTTSAAQPTAIDIFSIAADVFSGRSAQSNALSGVKASSVQRARQLRQTDADLFKKVQDFFVKNDADTARAISGKAGLKREQVDSWVRGAVSAKAIASLTARKESQPALLALLVVSSAITKYGELELVRKLKPAAAAQIKAQQQKQQQKTSQSAKQQQQRQQVAQQSPKKSGNASAQQHQQKKNVPGPPQKTQVQAKIQQTPPPAPVTAKSSKTVTMTKSQARSPTPTQPQAQQQSQQQSQKALPAKNAQQNKNAAPVKSSALQSKQQQQPEKQAQQSQKLQPKPTQQQIKTGSPVKDVSAVWAGPLPATVLQSTPAAIVSSAPGRASVARAYRA